MKANQSARSFASDENANVSSIGSAVIMTVVLILGAVLAAVISIVMVNNLADPFFTNLADFNTKLTNGTFSTGDATGDSLFPVWAIVLGILGSLALPFIVIGAIAAIRYTRGRGG